MPNFPAGRDPLELARATLYLPTRRACRFARDVFLDVTTSSAAILPRIVAIGDVDEDEIVENQIVSGIAYSRNEARITVQQVKDRPGVAAAIFGPLAEANINVDMIVQSVSRDGVYANMTFTVGKADMPRALAVLERAKAEVGFEGVSADSDVVKVSVIGVGMRSHAGIAHKMFATLAAKGINIQAISTSEIKVSVLIGEEYTELALRTLHTAYGLDRD